MQRRGNLGQQGPEEGHLLRHAQTVVDNSASLFPLPTSLLRRRPALGSSACAATGFAATGLITNNARTACISSQDRAWARVFRLRFSAARRWAQADNGQSRSIVLFPRLGMAETAWHTLFLAACAGALFLLLLKRIDAVSERCRRCPQRLDFFLHSSDLVLQLGVAARATPKAPKGSDDEYQWARCVFLWLWKMHVAVGDSRPPASKRPISRQFAPSPRAKRRCPPASHEQFVQPAADKQTTENKERKTLWRNAQPAILRPCAENQECGLLG